MNGAPGEGPLAGRVRTTLRIGIVVATTLLVIGLAIAVAQGDWSTGLAGTPTGPGGLIQALTEGRGIAVILLGVVVVLLTPLARVAVSLATFAKAKDLPFVAITSFVLAVLAMTVWVGVVP